MKKTLFVAALAALLVFAFAGTAFAKVSPGYVEWTAGGANGTTPHKGYAVNSDKCAVCHSAHNAPGAGATYDDTNTVPVEWTVSATENTQMLLRSSVSNACSYCHIQTNIGGKQLYMGTTSYYTDRTALNPYENFGHQATSASCSKCHSVHGANTWEGAVATKILKYEGTKQQAEAVAGYAAAGNQTGADKFAQVSVFCTQCHWNYSGASETSINVAGQYTDAFYTIPAPAVVKHHPLKAVGGEGTDLFKASGSTIGTLTAVAFSGSQYCRSCHDAGIYAPAAGYTDNSFPHLTKDSYNFMTAAGNAAGRTDLDSSYAGTTTTAAGITGPVDGHCLKCHVSADDLSGVGKTF